jgi:hypothetical protein
MHQPAGSAVGAAAFMAGLGAGAERRRKYAMDMWQDERRLQARREDLEMGYKYRSALGGRRGLPRLAGGGALALAGGGQAMPAQQVQRDGLLYLDEQDPSLLTPGQQVTLRREQRALAISGPGSPQERVQNRSQDDANARAMRLGRPLPFPDPIPEPVVPLTRDQQQRQWQLQDDATKRRQELADRYEGRQYEEKQLSDKAQRKLDALDAAVADMAANPDFDEAQKKEFYWRAAQERAGIQSTASMPRPEQRETPWEDGQQEQWFDKKLGPGVYKDLRGRGIVPYLDSKGEMQFFESKSQPQAQVQADEQLTKRMEYQEKLQSLAEKRTKAVEDRDFAIVQAKANNPVVKGGLTGTDDTSQQDAAIEAINKRYDDLNKQYDEYEKLLREAYGTPSGGAQPAPAQDLPPGAERRADGTIWLNGRRIEPENQ